MSKKSRRRNKKLLAMLALAGGAAMMGRRKGSVAADVDSGRAGDSASAIARSVANAAPIRKDVMPISKAKSKVDHLGDPYFSLADPAAGMTEVKKPKYKPTNIYSDSGAMFKKGGRVTGIAKRGFGRALMKGKK